jgi:type III pantothenate kinase
MILLLDIGNTHTHLGLADTQRVLKRVDLPTRLWAGPSAPPLLRKFVGRATLEGTACCSVVPDLTPRARRAAARVAGPAWFHLTSRTAVSIIDPKYPQPSSIGPDRLANAIAARHHYGAPCIAIDFGTAVTFDVVGRAGRLVGGVIAPGAALMTRYLHEKTALLPEVEMRPTRRVIGRNTKEAMQIAAFHGFRGMVQELIRLLKRDLDVRRLPVVATGGYARVMSAGLAEITAVHPGLTLEGIRLACLAAPHPPAVGN